MRLVDALPTGCDYFLNSVDPPTRELFDRFDEGHRPSDTEEQPAFGLWVQMRLSLGDDGGHDYDDAFIATVREIAESEIPWTPRDVRLLWYVAEALMTRSHTNYQELYRIPLAAARHLDHSERRSILGTNARELKSSHRPVWDSLHEQLDQVLTEPPEHGPAGIVRNLIWEGDPLARALADVYTPRLVALEVLPLLRHWTTARSSKPGDKWLEAARTLLTGEAVALVRDLLAMVAAHRESRVDQVTDEGYEWTETIFLTERTSIALRGMVWTCALIDEPWVAGLLGDLAVTCGVGIGGTGANCRSEMLAGAAVHVFARRGGLDAVPALARVQAKVRKKSVLSNVARTLDAVAEATGLRREQLLDRTVPTFGLGPDGVREERVGDHVLHLQADGPALAIVNAAGRTLKSVPQAIRREPALAELKATLKEVRQALPAERFRLERALIEERRWRWRDVVEFFLDHPLTGLYARNLIWQILQGPAGMPVNPGSRSPTGLRWPERFLRVRGDLRTYKIHLGSGNILMEPNDAYLCIVPAPDRSAGRVFLPFEEEGGMLSIILSKAFLLADDTAITDPTITSQLVPA